MKEKCEIGIIGGSGFYEFGEKPKEVSVNTKYGKPSDKITIFTYQKKRMAFLPRHGKKHQFSPSEVPYRANIQALKDLGVKHIIAPTAVGSLQPKIKPGNFVICDQFVDLTKKRKDTFFDGIETVHITSLDAYCPVLRKLATKTCKSLKIPFQKEGTVVVIEGPRFASIAESRLFSSQGFSVINMTQYPEVILAHERQMCYVNISLVTDYDVGLYDLHGLKHSTVAEIIKIFKNNNDKVRNVILEMIKNWPKDFFCSCQKSLEQAIV